MNKLKLTRRDLFASGFCTAFCVMSLFQDFLGKEDYIDFVRHGWVTAKISVPLAIICFLLNIFVLVVGSWAEKKHNMLDVAEKKVNTELRAMVREEVRRYMTNKEAVNG